MAEADHTPAPSSRARAADDRSAAQRAVDHAAEERSPGQRAADHAAIDRLTADLLPALVAKLGATGLGEIEVREGDWKVRLRRPADGSSLGRRTSERPARAQPGHAGHGHPPAALEGHRPAAGDSGRPPAGEGGRRAPSTNGHGPELAPVGPGRAAGGDDDRRGGDPHRAVATSPAVGIFQPRPDAPAGTRVRAGDRIGAVDMLGVPLEVVAPADGVIGASLVEAGQAVEYGQDLIVVELLGGPPGGTSRSTGAADGDGRGG